MLQMLSYYARGSFLNKHPIITLVISGVARHIFQIEKTTALQYLAQDVIVVLKVCVFV